MAKDAVPPLGGALMSNSYPLRVAAFQNTPLGRKETQLRIWYTCLV